MTSSAKPLPMRCRALGALELAPMTIRQLARRLSTSEPYARKTIDELRGLGVIRPAGTIASKGRPGCLWSIAA